MDLFAPALIESFHRVNDPGTGLHLHLISDDDAAITRFTAMSVGHKNLGATIERAARTNTYYACSRFMIAPILHRLYRRPIIVIDLDMILMQPASSVVEKTAHADIARFSFPAPPLPTMVTLAGFVVLNPTSATEIYLARLNGLIAAKMAVPRNWMLDQAAMFNLERLNDSSPFCQILDLSLLYPGYVGGLVEIPEHRDKMAIRLANG